MANRPGVANGKHGNAMFRFLKSLGMVQSLGPGSTACLQFLTSCEGAAKPFVEDGLPREKFRFRASSQRPGPGNGGCAGVGRECITTIKRWVQRWIR